MGSEDTLVASREERGDAATRVRAGDFKRLTDRELDRSYGLACLILGDRDDAEDAVHDALESAWLRWDSLRDTERLGAWFRRIVTNACCDLARRRRITPITMSELPEQAAADHATGVLEREFLREALRALDVDHRMVLVLRYYEDLAVDEIARRLGERPGTVKSRLHYGLRTLRADIDAAARSVSEGDR